MLTKTRLLSACAAAGLVLCVSAPASATRNVCARGCSTSFTRSLATPNLATTSNQNATFNRSITFTAATHANRHSQNLLVPVTPAVVPLAIDPNDHPADVPEPSTWAATLLGFGILGLSMRRKRRKAGMLTQFA